jgi:hypothetical protein
MIAIDINNTYKLEKLEDFCKCLDRKDINQLRNEVREFMSQF